MTTRHPAAEAARLDRRRMVQGAAGLAVTGLASTWPQPASARAVNELAISDTTARSHDTMGKGGLSAARLLQMHEAMARHVESGYLPGLVSLVSRRGEAHVDAIGLLEYDGREPMDQDTIFRIASVTKPIIAAVAMVLVEECVLRLDDPVDAFLPELAARQVLRTPESALDDTVPAKRSITLRDLLTFRAGYGAIFTTQPTPLTQALQEAGVAAGPILPTLPPDDFLAAYGRLPLLHQPGEQWLYNTGSDILGVLIARASGQSLGDVLQERLFAPLGMQDTGFFVPAEKINRLAGSYWTNFETGEFEVFDPVEGSRWASPPVFESGSGGLASTADDLLAFGEMMLGNGTRGETRILSRPSVELMTMDHITPEQKARSPFFPETFWDNRGWGFGVSVITRRDNLQDTPGRYGWDGGYGTQWSVDPTEELIGILLTQRAVESPAPPPTYLDFWTSAYQAIDD